MDLEINLTVHAWIEDGDEFKFSSVFAHTDMLKTIEGWGKDIGFHPIQHQDIL